MNEIEMFEDKGGRKGVVIIQRRIRDAEYMQLDYRRTLNRIADELKAHACQHYLTVFRTDFIAGLCICQADRFQLGPRGLIVGIVGE